MSSGSESDDDYVPEEPVQVSEEESADEETNFEYEKEIEHKALKRKSKQPVTVKKKLKKNDRAKEILSKEKETSDEVELDSQNPKEDKKREDDLWAKFLEGTEQTKSKSTKSEQSFVPATKSSSDNPESIKASVCEQKKDDVEREKRIFEFAGETIVVENNVIKEKIKTPETSATVSKLAEKPGGRGGGLSSVLGQLNKKNTLSTLEKSKLDWNTYKKDEGVEEEIASINKGKAGFLDRRDFLERTDMRQYEIERDLRMSRRTKR